MTEVVKIYQLVENLSLEVVYGDEESLNRTIKTGEISRPGLELTGAFISDAPFMCERYSSLYSIQRTRNPRRINYSSKRKWRFCITFTDFNFPFTRGTIQLFRWPFSCSHKCPWGFS